MFLTDIKPDSRKVTLAFSDESGYYAVGIDLLTGKLSACKPKPQPPDMTLPSPSGRLRIRCFDEGDGFTIETSAGKRTATIKGKDMVYPLAWSADESVVYYDRSYFGSDAKDGVHIYDIKSGTSRLLILGDASSIENSPDKRWTAFILKKSSQDRNGILAVFDGRTFKKVRSVGAHVSVFTFSPDGKRIAYTELVKDEYGDLASTALRVLNIKTGRTNTLLTNRRKLIYVWAGNDSLLVSVKDKYSVPSLVLVNLSGGKTVLTTNPKAGFIQPFAYLPATKRSVYKISKSIYEYEAPEELWAVEPGHAPVRLFPVKGAGHE